MDGSVGLQVRGSRQSSAVLQYSVGTNASETPSELATSRSPPYPCYGFRLVLLSRSLSQSLSLLLDTIDRNLMAGGGTVRPFSRHGAGKKRGTTGNTTLRGKQGTAGTTQHTQNGHNIMARFSLHLPEFHKRESIQKEAASSSPQPTTNTLRRIKTLQQQMDCSRTKMCSDG